MKNLTLKGTNVEYLLIPIDTLNFLATQNGDNVVTFIENLIDYVGGEEPVIETKLDKRIWNCAYSSIERMSQKYLSKVKNARNTNAKKELKKHKANNNESEMFNDRVEIMLSDSDNNNIFYTAINTIAESEYRINNKSGNIAELKSVKNDALNDIRTLFLDNDFTLTEDVDNINAIIDIEVNKKLIDFQKIAS